jgi:hypothetical protein
MLELKDTPRQHGLAVNMKNRTEELPQSYWRSTFRAPGQPSIITILQKILKISLQGGCGAGIIMPFHVAPETN